MSDEMLEELGGGKVQAIDKIRYTHADMVDFIISNPGVSQNAVAARYGYTPAWVSQVMSSDAFRELMAARRTELIDPVLAATIDERFRALTNLSLDRLMEKLAQPAVTDNVVLRAVELGAKAMGVGGNAAPPPPPADHLAALANRLLILQSNIHQGVTYENAEIVDGDGETCQAGEASQGSAEAPRLDQAA